MPIILADCTGRQPKRPERPERQIHFASVTFVWIESEFVVNVGKNASQTPQESDSIDARTRENPMGVVNNVSQFCGRKPGWKAWMESRWKVDDVCATFQLSASIWSTINGGTANLASTVFLAQ
jgi:hypothetical protein